MIIYNARVRSMDGRRPVADSVTVSGNRITGVGARPNGDDESRIDAKGLCVVPGLTDSHVHFASWALGLSQPRLGGVRSIDEVIERVRGAKPAPSGWIRGLGWAESEWEKPVKPSKEHLDAVFPEQPVALMSKDYHSLWLNSVALRQADSDLEVPGGVVERDATGEPIGILREEAAWAFRDRYVRPTQEEMAAAVAPALEIASARGVTAIHDKDGWLDMIPVWREVHAEHGIPLRVWQSYPPSALDELDRLAIAPEIPVRLGYIKVFMDGTVGSGTALMSDGSGVEMTSEAALAEIIEHAAEHGLSVGVHAIGDLANRRALGAFETTREIWKSRDLRPRIEHAQLLDREDVCRFAELGVTASVQFSHAPSDRERAEAFLSGRDIVAYGFQSLLSSGAVLVNGSDAPVESLAPLRGIQAGVARTFDERPPWRPEEAVTAWDALNSTTRLPAWLAREEGQRGEIRAGQLADLVVLDRDPLESDPREIGEIEVVATMFDGKWVHNPPPW